MWSGYRPDKPIGSDREFQFHRSVHDFIQKFDIVGRGITVERQGNRYILSAKPGGVAGGESVEVDLCDPTTGEVKTYRLFGFEVTSGGS